MMMKRLCAAVALIVWGITRPALALDNVKNLDAIGSYLNASKGMEAVFEQMDVNGTRLTGTFYLLRPGRLRFHYNKPSTLQIFADGRWLVNYDGDNQEYTTLALSETPASFLTADPINLRDPQYSSQITETNNTVSLTLSKKNEPDLGSLTLIFKKAPLTLTQWIVIDSQRLKTVVNLGDIKRFDSFSNKKLFDLPPGISLPSR